MDVTVDRHDASARVLWRQLETFRQVQQTTTAAIRSSCYTLVGDSNTRSMLQGPPPPPKGISNKGSANDLGAGTRVWRGKKTQKHTHTHKATAAPLNSSIDPLGPNTELKQAAAVRVTAAAATVPHT
jgi:hypothetical protein